GVGADIRVIAVRAREGGGDVNAARVELAVVDLDVDVVVADRQFVGGAPCVGFGPAVVVGGGGGGGADKAAVGLAGRRHDRSALVVQYGLVGGSLCAARQVPGIARIRAGLGLDEVAA